MQPLRIVWITLLLNLTQSALGFGEDPLANLRPGHPRLLVTDAQLAESVRLAKDDPLRAEVHARIVAIAETHLGEKPVERVLVGPRLLDKSRTALKRILAGAMAFRLTGDSRFADRAKAEMFAAAAFSDWNPSHFLDVAEMSLALSLGYDWLHASLNEQERRVIRDALVKHALAFAADAYEPTGPRDERLWFVNVSHNWNQVCNAGLLAGALALADEEPDLARTVITGVRRSLPLAMATYQSDGAYPEGPIYWTYGTSFNVVALAMLDSALGTDFGLGEAAAFDQTTFFRLAVISPIGATFNFGDAGKTGLNAASEYTWLAHRYHQPVILAHSRTLLAADLANSKPGRENDRLFALHAVWFPEGQTEAVPPAPLDARFRGPAQIAVFRSAWNDPNALYLGFKAGGNKVNHSHLDLGSFILDADGIRWAEDLGVDDYNLPGYFGPQRWSYFRLTNKSHNTITPGEALQDPRAEAPLVAFGSTPQKAFAIADLSAVYPGVAKSLLRGVALLDRSRVVIQDEFTALTPGTPLRWQMVTESSVTLVDARHARLTKGGRTLNVQLLEPDDARFQIREARPPTPAEKQNEGFSILSAEIPASSAIRDGRIVVVLAPAGENWPARATAGPVEALSTWK